MNFIQFHVGDWVSATSILSATERGVYLDLLVRYYKEERPIMQEECKRIARAYAKEEQEAMQYVLQTFFTLSDGAYHQKRCDEEIERAHGLSDKRKSAAAARWGKKNKDSGNASGDASALQTESNCNATGMLTNNQEPITKKEEVICPKPAVSDKPDASDVDSDNPFLGDDLPAETEKKPFVENDSTPVQRIVALYNEILGDKLPKVVRVTPSRAQAVRARWHDLLRDTESKSVAEGLENFRDYFTLVSKTKFLMEGCQGNGHDNWRANFDFLMKQKTYVKLLERSY